MTPEQKARGVIDRKLAAAGWVVQDLKSLDLGAARDVAVREYSTATGPADYVLFVDREAVGVIEAKRDEAGESITQTEQQTARYANATLKWRMKMPPLPSTGLRDCQVGAVTGLEASLAHDRPRALVHMATVRRKSKATA